MSVPKWSPDTTVKFVSEYVLHDCLWNYKHPHYKNKALRARAIKSIENVMNLPNFGEKEVLAKIKNIRSTYCQEVKKIRESKAQDNNIVRIPNLIWFPILDSVLNGENMNTTIKSSPNNWTSTTETIRTSPPRQNSIQKTENVETVFPALKDYNEIEVENEGVEALSFQETDVDEASICSDEMSPEPERPRKRKLRLSDPLVRSINSSEIVNVSNVSEHEFDIFGKSVAAQLKTLPLDKALKAQQHIQTYITELRLKQFSSTSSF